MQFTTRTPNQRRVREHSPASPSPQLTTPARHRPGTSCSLEHSVAVRTRASASALASLTPTHGGNPASPGHSAHRCEHPVVVRTRASASALASLTPTHGGNPASPGHSALRCEHSSWFEYERALPHSPPSPRLTAAARHRPDTPPIAANIQSWFEHERALPHSPPSPQLTAATRHRPTISPIAANIRRGSNTSERFRTRLPHHNSRR